MVGSMKSDQCLQSSN